jgi:hypothetical protein
LKPTSSQAKCRPVRRLNSDAMDSLNSDDAAALHAVSSLTDGQSGIHSNLSLPSNMFLRQSIIFSDTKTDPLDGENLDSKHDQKVSNSTSSLRRATAKAADIVKALAGSPNKPSVEPTALDMNILKKTGAVRPTAMKKEDSFERFTREMTNRSGRAVLR